MKTIRMTYYFVQEQNEYLSPRIVYREGDIYKFLDRKVAEEFLQQQVQSNPSNEFRLVKCKEEYEYMEWN